jgi:hypothetical protein
VIERPAMRRLAVLVIALAVLGLAAAGAGTALARPAATPAAYVKTVMRVDARLRHKVARTRRAAKHDTTVAQRLHHLRVIRRAYRVAAARVDGLDAPAGAGAEQLRYVRALRRTGRTEGAAAAAVRANSPTRLTKALNAFKQRRRAAVRARKALVRAASAA